MDLTAKRCVPCEGDVPRLDVAQIDRLIAEPQVAGFRLIDDRRKIARTFKFKAFRAGIAFVNRLADIAEEEGHHPDFSVHYDVVDVVIYTHAAKGLTENDFILAAKLSAAASAAVG